MTSRIVITILFTFLAVSVVGCGPTKVLHLRTAADDYRSLGIDKNKVEAWEDGRRSSQDASSFEWWYFDSLMDDGTAAVVTFSDNFGGSRKRRVSLDLTTPDGKHRTLNVDFDEAVVFAKDHTLAKLGPHLFEGNLDTYKIYVDANNPQRLGVDLVLKRLAPSFRAATGYVSAGDKYFAWLNAVPYGEVIGTVTIDGKKINVKGNGYHDHNWGNAPISDLLDSWWWGRASVGDRRIVTYDIHGKQSVGGSTIDMYYVGTTDQIEVNAFGDRVAVEQGLPMKHPDPNHGRPIRSSVSYSADGIKTTFSISGPLLSSLNLLDGQSWTKRSLAGILGKKPWYSRFRSPVTLSLPGEPVQSGKGILESYELK